MISRHAYLNQILPLVDQNYVKILTGIQDVGKSVLLKQIQEYLIQNGKMQNQIAYINFDSFRFRDIKDGNQLYVYLINAHKQANGKLYIFLDEIKKLSQ
ncbi:MAG: AAA family ATPase, partial [Christensenellaceae bacterium]|nr:AAA family ATPase [Christensenellaceae bacterium]